jgi:hypothetical protein
MSEEDTRPNLTGAEILLDVNDLKLARKKYLRKQENSSLSKDEFREKMKNDFSDLSQHYPTIFEKAISGGLDDFDSYNQLKSLLEMKDKVDQGKMAEFDASAKIGTQLFDKYVKPNLPENKSKPVKKGLIP